MSPRSRVRFDRLRDVLAFDADTLLVTQPGLEEHLGEHLPSRARPPVLVASLDESALERLLADAGSFERIVGLGGGTAIDTAKFVAWRSGAPLVQVPSVLSVDAPFTREIAVRRDGRIHYVGAVDPQAIVVDAALIRTAPPAWNRGGVGDLLSIHTALADWRDARDRFGERYDEAIAERSAAILERLAAGAEHVAAVDDDGIRLVTELFCEEVALCQAFGSSRPEEGAEHHVLYHLEWMLGRTLPHGPAVTACALAVAELTANAPAELRRLARACGVDWSAAALGIDAGALVDALAGAPGYAEAQELPPTLLTGRGIDRRQAASAVERTLDDRS